MKPAGSSSEQSAVCLSSSRYAVAGHPVEHSHSPFIHGEFARMLGQAVVYERLPCPLDAFAATVRSFAESGASGCNVTIPFKFEAFALAARATPRASLAQACNTLRFDPDGWSGDNTDGAGLVLDIANAGVDLHDARVLLIGAGGAAAGALGPLASSGAREIVVANRTPGRAEALVARHQGSGTPGQEQPHLRATALDQCGEAFDIVINASASSVAGAAVPVAASVLRPGALALDMMYGPSADPFLAWAAAHGAVARDGLGMLVEQAAEAFCFFRGIRPSTPAVLASLRQRVARR